MHLTSFCRHRLAAALAVATMLGLGSPASVRAKDFPPLNTPATNETHPGKFVWAELYTSDPEAAAKFYTGVFGWTDGTVDHHFVDYVVFSNENHPIAGLRKRSAMTGKHASRWVHYISVTDLAASLALVTKAGGIVRGSAKFPKMGSQGIITDPEGSPVGLIQSTSGDSADNDPAPGEWNWVHLFVKTPQTAADFYRQVFNYDVAPDSRPGKSAELLLSSTGFNRGGISVLEDHEDAKPGWLGSIRVANLDETLARVPGLGGEVMVAPHEALLGSRFAVIADPTGGTVGVVEYSNNANPVNHP